MAWTAPITWTSGAVVTKANLDQQIRDNMLETAPAKAATTGYFIRVTGANAIEEADTTDGAKLDGDKIDIDITLPNITPDTGPSEVDDVNDLGAILKGISDAIGSTNTHTLWINVQSVTGTGTHDSNFSNEYGVALVGDSSNDGSAVFSMIVPNGFSSLSRAFIWVLANGTGNLRYSVDVSFGADGEAQDNNTDSISATTRAMTSAQLDSIDISAAFTGIAALDILGLAFNRIETATTDTLTDLRVMGIEFEYVRA